MKFMTHALPPVQNGISLPHVHPAAVLGSMFSLPLFLVYFPHMHINYILNFPLHCFSLTQPCQFHSALVNYIPHRKLALNFWYLLIWHDSPIANPFLCSCSPSSSSIILLPVLALFLCVHSSIHFLSSHHTAPHAHVLLLKQQHTQA